MSKLTPAIKRAITKDWREYFPAFGVYRPMWLARRIGPIVQGVILDRSSSNDDYLPKTHVHYLVEPADGMYLMLCQDLQSIPHRVSERIQVRFHSNHIPSAPQRLKADCILPTSTSFSVDEFMAAAESYHAQARFGEWSRGTWNGLVLLLAWAGREGAAKQMIERAVRSEHEALLSFREPDVHRPYFLEWKSEIENLDLDPGRLENIVNEQVVALKLEKLPVYEMAK